MFSTQITINFILYLTGLFGIIFSRKSLILILMALELTLLAVNLNFITFSIYLDDIIGQIFAILVLCVAAAESAIGLAIFILNYRVRGSIAINTNPSLRY